MHRPIRVARAVQYLAARAITTRGLSDPITRALLTTAALAAATAWEAGYRVTELHAPRRTE
ncbi:hypothetical protein [Streptomyces sp. V1I6]|uniref:hypothetical protein n=1 Tax=Streptomyces sp. V1I6 TaxID=3042273 RepID=UPI0027D87F51|nr:hypothetical protein [Streptomyces sp. V1I6]